MSPRQPVCKGTNEKGELKWGWIAMAKWQMRSVGALIETIRRELHIPYMGEFKNFWIDRSDREKTGREKTQPSLEIHNDKVREAEKRKARTWGD